jgi:RND family efflux transporter MFP subunit
MQVLHKDDDKQSSPLSPPSKAKRRRRWLWLSLLVLIVSLLFLRAVIEKISANREAVRTTNEAAHISVHIVHPQIHSAQKEIVLPGSVQAFSTTPIYARTSGYLKRWFVDIGARVHQGQLLAEIESPEIDQQLNQALGNVQRAQADMNLALITTERWQQLLARDTVSRQEADEKQGSFEAQRASFIAAQANVARLQELKGFERIYAPFDGVITTRNANIGDLITANNTSQEEMFNISDDSKLRIYLNVPEDVSSFIKVGQLANVVLASSPGIVAYGEVAHTASAIDPQSRTMLTEVRVDNSNHTFLSGGYATITFDIKLEKPPLTLPVNTILFRREGTTVGVVGENDRVSLRKVHIGKDFGTYVEITEGVTATDRVIVNPADSLQEGSQVRVEQ